MYPCDLLIRCIRVAYQKGVSLYLRKPKEGLLRASPEHRYQCILRYLCVSMKILHADTNKVSLSGTCTIRTDTARYELAHIHAQGLSEPSTAQGQLPLLLLVRLVCRCLCPCRILHSFQSRLNPCAVALKQPLTLLPTRLVSFRGVLQPP